MTFVVYLQDEVFIMSRNLKTESKLISDQSDAVIQPFYTAEIESLIECFAENKSNIMLLPKEDITDADNNLISQSKFEKRLSDIIKRALSDKKAKANTKFLFLLDCGAQLEPEKVNLNYASATVITNIGASRDYAELALLTFTKDSEGIIKYQYTAPKKFMKKEWLNNAFNHASQSNSIIPLFVETPEDRLETCVEICYQAQKFIDTDFAHKDQCEEKESKKDFQKLAQLYQAKLESKFYNTRPFNEAFKSNLSYFLIMLAGYMIFAGSRYAETWMVMSQDETLLESSTLPVTVMRVMVLLSTRPLESITMLGATAFGAKKYSEIGSLLRSGWFASAILTTVSIPILCSSEYWLRNVFNQNAELAKRAGDYLTRYAWSIPAVTASVADNNIFFATNDPGIVFLIELTTILTGVALTYIFVFGKLGFQPQGLTGFATSVVIQKWMNFALAKLYLYSTRNTRKYTIMSMPKFNDTIQQLKLIFRKGVPLTFQIGAEQLYVFIVTIYAGLYGALFNKKTLDQSNILNEYFTLLAISGGLVMHKTFLQRGAEVRGRDLLLRAKHAKLDVIQQNLKTIPQILIANLGISVVFTLLVGGLYTFGCDPLVSVYTGSNNFKPENVEQIKDGICFLFKILAACTLTEMVNNVMGGALNGLGDVDSPMFRSLFLTVAVGGGLGYFLCFNMNYGLTGVYSSSLMAYFIGALALTKTLYSTYNNLKNSVEEDTESGFGKGCSRLSNFCSSLFNCGGRRTSVDATASEKEPLLHNGDHRIIKAHSAV